MLIPTLTRSVDFSTVEATFLVVMYDAIYAILVVFGLDKFFKESS